MNDWILGDGAAILSNLCARLTVEVPDRAMFGVAHSGDGLDGGV